MEKKAATEQEINQAMQTLGHQRFDMPGDADVPEKVQEKQIEPDLEETQEIISDTSDENPEVDEKPEVEVSEEISDEELKRRGFQAEAEREKQRAKMLEEQNRLLMQALTGVSKPQQQVQQKQEVKKPSLYDFIEKEDYDPSEALDPSTVSGQAYDNWQAEVRKYETQQYWQDFNRQSEEKQNQTAMLKAAREIAKEYPEFKMPFSDEPDLQKISMVLGDLSKPENLPNLIRLSKGQVQKNQTTSEVIDKVGKRANNLNSAATSTSGSSETKKKLPESIQNMQKLYGNHFQIPGNFG